jgi:hypothetical protein
MASLAPLLSAAALAVLLVSCARGITPPGGQQVQVIATLAEKPGDPAVTADGRVIFTMHPLNRPTFRLMERRPDGGVVPFPDPQRSRTYFDNPLGIRAAANGTLWILDMGNQAGAAAWPAARPPRLIGWDLRRNTAFREIPMPRAVLRPNSWPQDFALDQRRGIAFIADSMRADPTRDDPPAIIVVDLRSGAARRILDGHPSFEPAPLPALTLNSGLLRAKGTDGQKHVLRFGLDPITIDTDYEWVIWGPGNGFGLYRARSADLSDPALPAAELARRVERYGDKPASDGISIDRLGNVYVTDVLRNAIGVSTTEGYRVLARDPRLIWPDGTAFGPDGLLYATISQFDRMPLVNDGQDRGEPPYLVLRLRPLAPSAIGR